MSDTFPSNQSRPEGSRDEMMSALFANLVIQQTNMALTLMGHAPHPETGERVQDLESARLFIDQLEMLQVKTKGNLDKREEHLLNQSLTSLRMAFVEAVEAGPAEAPQASAPTGSPAASSGTPPPASPAEPASPEGSEESRKKFTKKY